LNGTGPGAGRRPASDYDTAQCTGGHCDRRATYLELVTRLLVGELAWMQEQWRKGGQARESLGKKTEEEAVAGIVLGLARFAMGELAGERMKLGLMLHDPEEEQDCFSDNTHWSHYYNSLGLRNVYTGIYVDRSGRKMEGPSLSDLVRQGDAEVDRRIRAALEALLAATRAMVDSAEREGVAYDQLLAEGNDRGRELILTAITALTTLSQGLDRALVALGIDHLADDPGALAP
jgi:putative iron-regulated protein